MGRCVQGGRWSGGDVSRERVGDRRRGVGSDNTH